jgi:Zn-dependent protease
MGYQDRHYYRDSGGGFNPLTWLFTGSVPLFTIFGIRVRAHAGLIVLIVLTWIFGLGTGYTLLDQFVFGPTLFVVILLHELGHCFGARLMGGTADEILLSPMGGLAFTMAPRRPLAQFVTVAAGPLVNALLMVLSALAIYAMNSRPSWNMFQFLDGPRSSNWIQVYIYLQWFFQLNYLLLVFNLLPVFPLDGGQLLQAGLWKPLGFYRSMLFATTVGIVGAVLMCAVGLSTRNSLLFVIGFWCAFNAYQVRAQTKAAGKWGFSEEEEDYSASLSWRPQKPKSAAASHREEQRRLREEDEARAEQIRIDRILEKVGRSGMHSLNWMEKRTLRKATERQRQRNLRR